MLTQRLCKSATKGQKALSHGLNTKFAFAFETFVEIVLVFSIIIIKTASYKL